MWFAPKTSSGTSTLDQSVPEFDAPGWLSQFLLDFSSGRGRGSLDPRALAYCRQNTIACESTQVMPFDGCLF